MNAMIITKIVCENQQKWEFNLFLSMISILNKGKVVSLPQSDIYLVLQWHNP